MPIGVFADFDSHGISIASFVSNKVRKCEGPLCAPVIISPKISIQSLFPAIVSSLSVAHNTACRGKKPRIIIADFPAQSPISTLFLSVINMKKKIDIFYVDHHPYFIHVINEFKKRNVTPVISSGAGMSVNLYRIAVGKDEKLLQGIRDPAGLQVKMFVKLLEEDSDALILLYGLLADSDWSGAKAFLEMGYGDIDDVIRYAVSFDTDFRALGYSLIGEDSAKAISYFRHPDEVWERTPFVKFSKKVAKFKEEEVLGGRAVIMEKPDIPKSYVDKAIAIYMWREGYDYVIIKKDDESGKRVSVAAKWWDGKARDVFSEIFKNIVADNQKYSIHGSQTFATVTPSINARENDEFDFEGLIDKILSVLSSLTPI